MTARKTSSPRKATPPRKAARKLGGKSASKTARNAARKSAKKAAKKSAPTKASRPASREKADAAKTFAKGDKVTWTTPQGETAGVVERKVTRPMKIKEHEVAASAENPEYVVRSDASGKTAAHKPKSLRKRGA